ncbi:hypothetical protein M5W83_10160 [Paenibacillus thiaminolyticus]|uniref:Transposase IS204/IS1001/IS1096/IS1165 helix-turn-helix domain-containing protein n=1 Tax=Paenibacillus thiaminolyticus TaxID=49283 RepID=A0ABT4FVL6_PANTH|nr:helix-turn-helix domain-containing protein [Paenibacillus thiaminolyticus]MCY9537574.1 hypothetical protein [Paenibacillus thiaminolyticus]MCY9600687.1 hypothetical protein [Paenibacillus thiaminolyticus]MCY9607515.1 hypothetical protein [Paenibacillus thiaminolyticus]MCY9611315.1 hypothetical protein [Paenibacillus thiaminolyticus]MCY9619393.1 hypothetical protein [Paenibacillus thiaminolyticus]
MDVYVKFRKRALFPCAKWCNSITRVNVPWALDKPKHYFPLLFDALIIKLAKDMPMNAVSRLLGEHETRLWRMLHHYVDNAFVAQDLSYVTKISTDETSAKRGHNYIAIFMDPEQKNIIYVTQWGLRCRLDPMVEVAKMLQKHDDGVIRRFYIQAEQRFTGRCE